MRTAERTTRVLDQEIKAILTYTEAGITAVVAGGHKAHIGAVTVVSPDGSISTTTFPGHKETIVAEHWGKKLYETYHQPIVVTAGIHYDQISKEGIQQVVEACADLLAAFLQEEKYKK